MNRRLLLILLLVPLVSAAQVYKTTDERGNVTFSDTAPKGVPSERIEIRSPNTAPPPPERPAAPASSSAEEDKEPVAAGYSLSIVYPANETTIPMGPGNFSISAKVEPALGKNDFLQLYLDGIPWGVAQQSSSWALTNVFRGAHDLKVAVTNADGKHLAGSDPIRVYVLRPSSNFKNRN